MSGSVVDNEGADRFELAVDGSLAVLEYRRRGDELVLVHTEVPDALSGRGVGGELVEAAVDAAAAHGWTIVPRCPFARSWLERHPEAAARVSVAWSG